MKLLTTLLLLTAVNAFGQEALNDGDVDGPQTVKVISLWQTLIPIVVPILVALFKSQLPKVPKVYLPILAVVLGAVIDLLLNFADLGAGKGIVGAVMGGAGVALREILHETKKAAQKRISS